MKKDRKLTGPEFDKFLYWLDRDRAEAAEQYEETRRLLIKLFMRWGCTEAEEQTDEAIDRVIRRVQEMADTYVGERKPYLVAVARNVFREWLVLRRRTEPLPLDPPNPGPGPDDQPMHDCLEQCLDHLSDEDRFLVLDFYKEDKQAKIDHRKELAGKMGIGTNALRIRVHRIRVKLHKCIEDCLKSRPVM